jgi:F420-non-reducing hydrogenase iron-sulfur subunit
MFEPRIVCFFCKWCTYAGADLAGTSRKQYPPNGVVVRVNCSGRIDPQHILWAFREGADGVLVGGCHPGDCHYQDGNYKTMRRVAFLRRMLEDIGIDSERLHLEWISAAEGEKLVHVMNDFVETVKKLGPMEVDLAGGGIERPAPPASPKKKVAKKAAKKPKAKPKKKVAKKTTKKKVAKKTKAKPKKKVAKKTTKKKVAKKAKAKPKKKVAKKKVVRKAAKKAKAKPKKKVAKKKVVKKAAKKAKSKPKKKAAKKTTRKKIARKPAKRRSR